MQKFVNLVDLVKGFPTTIYLQRFVSIQPRTSLSKFAKNSPKVRKKVRNITGLPGRPMAVRLVVYRKLGVHEEALWPIASNLCGLDGAHALQRIW